MNEFLSYLIVLTLGILLGAWLYAKFHAVIAAALAAKEAALIAEYNKLLALAHAERDKLFAVLHPASATTTVATVGAVTVLPNATDGTNVGKPATG